MANLLWNKAPRSWIELTTAEQVLLIFMHLENIDWVIFV